jgi:4-hydroxy-4-methyl-2-oxoglutarate aldolase
MKRLTGKIDAERIRMFQVPRAPEGIIDRIRAFGCDSSLISDAMDHLGIAGTLPASLYRPTINGAAIVGTATTVRNQVSPGVPTPLERTQSGRNGMAEMEAHNQATEGDILVIEGVEGLSNMGGISAVIAKRHGIAGALVRGGIRDVGHSREVGFPLWSTEISPVTGKWRIETVEINAPVQLHGVGIRPGDIIVADDTGICVIPPERADEVVSFAEEQYSLEAARIQAVAEGVHVADLPGKAKK